MNSLTSGRAAALAFLLVATLALGVSADRAFVTNRGGATVSIFDTTTNTELAGSPVTVGSGPIDIAADRPVTTLPQNLYVANSGSNSISVVQNNPPGVVATINSDSIFGSFATPSGVTLVDDGVLGPAIAMTDQKSTTYIFGGTSNPGRSTLRFIDPVSNSVVDAFQEPSPTARYNGVVFTSDPSTGHRRLWIADDGDMGVTVVKLDGASGPPFYFSRVITYQGSAEFADFIADTATTPAFLKAPRRLATNGTTRVVAADAGSKIVTIMDGNYTSTNTLGEAGAILANVDLSTWASAPLPAGSFTCVDVRVVGNFAYVTTSNTGTSGANVYQIDLTTFAIVAALALNAGATVGGLGATSDGALLYVGDGSTLTGGITQLDISPPTDFNVTAPVAVGPFTGGAMPFAFSSSATVSGGGPGPGPGPVWNSTSNATSTSHSGCGLVGLEAFLALLLLRRVRRS